jgi:hypothetical protein
MSGRIEMLKLVREYFDDDFLRSQNSSFRRNFTELYATEFADLASYDLDESMVVAARYGNIEAGEILINTGRLSRLGWDDDVVIAAAEGGHTAFLFWAFDHGQWIKDYIYDRAMEKAAFRGHIDMMHILDMKLPSRIAPITACILAAHAGQQKALKYLLEHNCVATEVIYSAITGGHLETVDFLMAFQEKNPHWNIRIDSDRMYECAAQGGHVRMLDTLLKRGYHMPTSSIVSCREAAIKGNWDALHWLHEHHFAWNSDVALAIVTDVRAYSRSEPSPPPWAKKRLAELRWAVEQGCPFNVDVVGPIVQADTEFAEWLLARLPKPITDGPLFYRHIIQCPIQLWVFGLNHGIVPPHLDKLVHFRLGDVFTVDKFDLLRIYWTRINRGVGWEPWPVTDPELRKRLDAEFKFYRDLK